MWDLLGLGGNFQLTVVLAELRKKYPEQKDRFKGATCLLCREGYIYDMQDHPEWALCVSELPAVKGDPVGELHLIVEFSDEQCLCERCIEKQPYVPHAEWSKKRQELHEHKKELWEKAQKENENGGDSTSTE